jgi:hypothetical protein
MHCKPGFRAFVALFEHTGFQETDFGVIVNDNGRERSGRGRCCPDRGWDVTFDFFCLLTLLAFINLLLSMEGQRTITELLRGSPELLRTQEQAALRRAAFGAQSLCMQCEEAPTKGTSKSNRGVILEDKHVFCLALEGLPEGYMHFPLWVHSDCRATDSKAPPQYNRDCAFCKDCIEYQKKVPQTFELDFFFCFFFFFCPRCSPKHSLYFAHWRSSSPMGASDAT